MHWDLGGLVATGWNGRSGAELASRERLFDGQLAGVMVTTATIMGDGYGRLTVEGGVHAANVHQEADHGHAHGSVAITEQLVTKDLAALAAPRHGVNVEVSEALLALGRGLVAVGKDLLLVVEDGAESRTGCPFARGARRRPS